MKSRLFRLFSFVVLVFGLSAVPGVPARAATLTVTNTNDSGPGSLRAAIAAAVNGDTITFSGVSGTILLSSQLEISHSITLTGPGSGVLSVSGGDAVRVFNIHDNFNVSISGLTITHGKVIDQWGGGIYNGSGTLTLNHVIVTNNQAVRSTTSAYGGGIVNHGTLIVTNSTISYNTANDDGGGLFNFFGAGLSMTNVVVDHNQVLAYNGGGLSIWRPDAGQTAGAVALDKVSITNNSATGGAGGIYTSDSLTISNSLVADNTDGGLWIENRVTDPQPVTIAITNTTIAGNTGGGVNIDLGLDDSSVTINNSTIANNNDGGGLTTIGPGVTYVKNTILSGNYRNPSNLEDCFGPIHSKGYNLILTAAGCTFVGDDPNNIYGEDPELQALAKNGGPTQTMALAATSPAVDAGNPALPGSGGDACEATDQRGISRPEGPYCDIGAFEFYVPHIIYLPLIAR